MTPASESWVQVDSRISEPIPEKVSGFTVYVKVAPQNVPNAIRAYADKENSRVVVEFRYFGHEELESVEIDQGIRVKVGVSTGRLYQMSVPFRVISAAAEAAKEVTFNLTDELERRLESAMKLVEKRTDYKKKNVSREYFDLATKVIREHKVALFQAVRV